MASLMLFSDGSVVSEGGAIFVRNDGVKLGLLLTEGDGLLLDEDLALFG